MISFKDYCIRLNEAVQRGNTYNAEKDSGAKGLEHKVGDSVWVKHPTMKFKTLSGKVTKIGRTLTTLQHKDGTEIAYPHASVSKDFEKLNPNPYRRNESSELEEAAFVSDSPATSASRDVKFDVVKNKEKSVGVHASGQPKEHHDVFHEGKHIGHVASYSGYKDKKPAGSRIVTSRKNVRLWQATIHGGEHNRHGNVFNKTPAGSQYSETGFSSKKDALQHLADAHNSNKNR
jgi:hypothetical protein